MPFIPHSPKDIQQMLEAIGVTQIESLFDEVPKELQDKAQLSELPSGMTEMAITRLLQDRAKQDEVDLNFIGAGAYEHYIPAAVWEIATRGEWMTAYTPYQAEASQGTLQLLYEYQTMMSRLMSMEVSNASLYDGASALAEAVLMAVRCNGDQNKQKSSKKHKADQDESNENAEVFNKSSTNKNPCILMPRTVHPHYRQVVKAIVNAQNIDLKEIPYSKEEGKILLAALSELTDHEITAIVIPMPNFFGVLEEVDDLVDWAHKKNILVIALVNPLAMSLLTPPGGWGRSGADIVCGEGQPLGVPLSSGGPYFGFLCCKKKYIRQLPGRLIGRTTDLDGKQGFTLTLQAREQHIRRAKATSNICTNQGLLVTAATIYMSLLGGNGLARVAAKSHDNMLHLREKLESIQNCKVLFKDVVFFHETVLQFKEPVDKILHSLAEQGIQVGFNLKQDYPELGEALLICTTETKTENDLNILVKALASIVQKEVSLC